MPVVGLVCCAAGGVETVRTGFVEPALRRGWTVAVTLTPTAATWLDAIGEVDRLAALTGLPVRSQPRLPGEPRPHPEPDCWVVAPATAGSVANLALGLTPNQAMTQLCEAIGLRAAPIVLFPRANSAHTGHPAYPGHLATLRAAGLHVIDGDAIWPIHPPRATPPDQPFPWPHLLTTTAHLLPPPP